MLEVDDRGGKGVLARGTGFHTPFLLQYIYIYMIFSRRGDLVRFIYIFLYIYTTRDLAKKQVLRPL